MNAIRTGTLIGLACLGACALMLVRADARRRARDSTARRAIEDWESEGGATATQPQVPGTTAPTGAATAAPGL
ncbi:MAG TPA: hypothetical protein PJ986_11230 [Gammaproteobacteria bacterium]|nr:hypothetical protein [Gammaproteobacteria bacterium]